MSRPHYIALFAALLCAPFAQAQASPFDTSSCPCPLRGIIVDSVTNQPIRNALVSLAANSSSALLTDADGRFQFDSLPLGPTIIQVTKPGYLSGSPLGGNTALRQVLAVAPDAPSAVVKFVPESIIFGQVTDESGEPLEGFSLDLYIRNPLNHQLIPASNGRSTTDDEGKFRIAGLRSGAYYLGVHQEQSHAATSSSSPQTPQGYAPVIYPNASDLSSASPLRVSPGTQISANFSLKLTPYVRLSGTISGVSPPQEVQFTVFGAIGNPVPAQCHIDLSLSSFQCANLPAGSYTLQAVVNSSSTRSAKLSASETVIASSDVSGIYLPLAPSATIPAYLHRSPATTTETHFESPVLFLIPLTAIAGDGIHSAQAPSSGPANPDVLTFRNVPPGSYLFSMSNSSEYYVDSATSGSTNLFRAPFLVGASGITPPIQLSFVPGAATLSGTVTLEGQETTAAIFLFHSEDQRQPEIQIAGDQGKFAFHGLAPDTYRILAIANFGAFDYTNPSSVARLSSQMQELTLSATQISTVTLEVARVDE